jgi:helix-turn-helix protein
VSIQVVGWALEYQDLPLDKRTSRPSSSAKLVLIALANHADRDGANCFPAVDTICWYTGLSERAVQYTLRELEDHGVIRKTPNPLVLEAKVDDPRKRPQSYAIVAFAKPDAVQPSAPSQGRVRRVRGAKSTGSRGAKSATSLHPNRPVTVLTPEPSIERSTQNEADASSSTSPLTVEDQNIDSLRYPPPRERGVGLSSLQDRDVWEDELADTDEGALEGWKPERRGRLFELISITMSGLEPSEEHAVESMLDQGMPWRKIMYWVGKDRGYDPTLTRSLIDQAIAA